jgi:hypothetical protein
MFLPPDGGRGHLLLDRPAHIQRMDFPGERPRFSDEHVDSVYISDLDGGNFRRVLPAGLRASSTQVLPDRQLLVLALDGRGAEGKPEEQLSQRAFRFNPRTSELIGDVALDSLASTAGRILGRP